MAIGHIILNIMDRKKIKILIALHGLKIRCRLVSGIDIHGNMATKNTSYNSVQYAFLEGFNDKSVFEYRTELYGKTYALTRTQAINKLLDEWYKLYSENKCT